MPSRATDPREKQTRPNRAQAPRAWRVAQFALYVIGAALLARLLVRTGDYFWFAIKCPYEIEYGEGILLQNAINIARGGVVYNNFHHYPYIVATYPPVYPLICAIGVKLFGVMLGFGRVVSCLASLGSAVLIWSMLRRAGIFRLPSAVAAMLFLAAPIVTWWGPVMRVDMTAVFLGLAGVYCVLRGGRWLIPAVVVMALAVYTRQSEIAPIAAAVAYLWWTKSRRSAALVAASWGALVVGAFGLLQMMSHGWFYQHVVVANQNFWELRTLLEWWSEWILASLPFPFVLGLPGVLLALAGWRPPATPHTQASAPQALRLLGLYFVFAMLISLTAGKIGAAVNYFIEPLAAACLMTGIALHWLMQRLQAPAAKVAWVAAWLLFMSAPSYALLRPSVDQYWPYRLSRHKTMAGGKAALALIRATNGPVLSEDTGLLPIAGKPVLLDPHKMTSMFRDGHWDQVPLIKDIKHRRFPLVISRWDPVGGATDRWGACGDYRWSMGMGRAIMQNYYLDRKVGYLYFSRPLDGRHPSCDFLHRQLLEERERHR
jgi:hypothetical protein